MRRQFPIALSLASVTAMAAWLANDLGRYTCPDIANVPTEDLSREAIRLVVDHQGESFALQRLCLDSSRRA